MVVYVVVDFSASGTKPIVRPVGFVRFIDQLLKKTELGKDDIVTQTCVENDIDGVGEVVGASVKHTWLSCSAPDNKNNAYSLFEFASGTDTKQNIDAAWLSGAIHGRFPGVHTWMIRNVAEGAVSS